MQLVRVQIHSPTCDSSEPYLFCSKCKSFIIGRNFKFCPYCGHKFTDHTVKYVDFEESELREKHISYGDFVDYISALLKEEESQHLATDVQETLS